MILQYHNATHKSHAGHLLGTARPSTVLFGALKQQLEGHRLQDNGEVERDS
jgi:hypothetical protein